MKSVPITVVLAAISVSACVSTPLAPGAGQVKVTRVTADVSSCKALGSLDLDAAAAGIDNAKNHFWHVIKGRPTVMGSAATWSYYRTGKGVLKYGAKY